MRTLFLMLFLIFIAASCTIMQDNSPAGKAEQQRIEKHTAQIKLQEQKCESEGGQIQVLYSADDLCWKDGKVIIVINGDTPNDQPK